MNCTSLLQFLCLWLALLTSSPSFAQAGCPDAQANNYDPLATQNDGSCLYVVTNYAPVFSANLPNGLTEISGLEFANNEWWAHNDSGFDPYFYSISPQDGAILKSIKLKDANNRDWEDICSNTTHLFVGDFGNNNNNRQNLGIYKVPFSAIGNGSNQTVNDTEYSFLTFAYPDQTSFNSVPEDSTVFDCEAMVYFQDRLHLFTKNRLEYTSTHYAIDPSNGQVEKLETFNTNGLITGASVSPDGEVMMLTGYDIRGLPTVFCWLLWDWPTGTDQFFSGNKRRIEFGSAFTVGQVESVSFGSNRAGYIANERTEYNGVLFVPQRTWSFDCSTWVPETVSTSTPITNPARLNYYPNPCGGTLFLEPLHPSANITSLLIINQLGQIVKSEQALFNSISLQHLATGCYTLRLTWSDGIQTRHQLIKD